MYQTVTAHNQHIMIYRMVRNRVEAMIFFIKWAASPAQMKPSDQNIPAPITAGQTQSPVQLEKLGYEVNKKDTV